MNKIFKALAGFALVALWTTNSQAIPVSYGTATHNTTAWQELADVPGGDEFGVSWTVDGGATWGREELYVGQSVQFKFNMHKDNIGTHYADLLTAWVDWGQDGAFDASDKVVYGEHLLSNEPTLGSWTTPTIPDLEYYSSVYSLTNDDVGETWLRALVTCSHSVTNMHGGTWSDQWTSDYTDHYEELLTPTGFYYQGETEEWKLVVNTVPEPTSIILFGMGLLGLASARKRASKANHA
jgi:hypothetical protein